MKNELQKALKSVTDEGDALETKIAAENRVPTAEEAAKFTALANQANGITKQIGDMEALKAAKKFGEESEGILTAAPAKFAGDTFGNPEPGNLNDIAADAKTGELYCLTGTSSKALNLLKSGAYKDAFNDQMKSRALGRPMKAASMKVLAEVGFTSGEAWLPPDYRAELIKKIAVLTSVRKNASVYTTGTDIVTFPSVNYTTDDKYTSGVRFSWRGSSAQTSDISEATNPVSGQVKIPVNLATAAIILQREQFEDNAFDLLGYVTQLGTEAFALGEEDAFTSGDGNGSPVGFIQHPSAAIAVGTVTSVNGFNVQGRKIISGSSNNLVWGSSTLGIIGTEAALAPQYENGAKWFANKKTYSYIRGINAGTATMPQWALGDSWPNYSNGMTASLLGYAIEKNQFMDDVATEGAVPLVLGDMKGYYIMDRVGLTVEVNPWVYQLRDQVVVYMRKRVGGQLVHYWRLVFAASAGA